MTETVNTSKKIRNFETGEKITGFFVLRKKEIKTKRDGAPYLLLGLGDATGRISATLWEDAKSVYDAIQVGDIVKVRGNTLTYNDILQLSVERIRKAEPSDGVESKNFVKKGTKDIEGLSQSLNETIISIKNPHLHKLLNSIFNDSWWLSRQDAPGGKQWHHAYLGGLLEHTLAVAKICETMSQLYPMADRDLLIAGALLHDIGKIEEYGFQQGFIDFTDEGRLWGHISIGAQRVREFIEKIEKESDFPQEIKKQLIHLILSHQGQLEHGSPVLPQTLEAMILYYSDEMDSKANALIHIIERDSEPGRQWSQYIQLLNRFIYLKQDNPPNKLC